MAASTISSQPFILSRITNNPSHPSLHHPLPSLFFLRRHHPRHRRPFLFTTSCHHVDGDDVVSTRKSTFNRGFTVISKMLRRIKPLDNSVISKGVSEASKDSMKQTISTMLGLLPSDHFDVTVSFEIQPLHRLLVSSIITGYTLWNAEYRMSLTRNLEMSHADQGADCETPLESLEVKGGEEEHGETEKVVSDLGLANSESFGSSSGTGVFGDLPPQALKYIQQLQSELTDMKEELNAQKQEMMQLEHDRGIRNNLLEYLRSFDPDMVTEMSRPSSEEVEDIIHQLVQNIFRRFLVDEASSNFMEQSVEGNIDYYPDDDSDEFSDKIATSRDYLAKLLFWCMLLGHHLRGLENRLHLSCVVGLI